MRILQNCDKIIQIKLYWKLFSNMSHSLQKLAKNFIDYSLQPRMHSHQRSHILFVFARLMRSAQHESNTNHQNDRIAKGRIFRTYLQQHKHQQLLMNPKYFFELFCLDGCNMALSILYQYYTIICKILSPSLSDIHFQHEILLFQVKSIICLQGSIISFRNSGYEHYVKIKSRFKNKNIFEI